MEKQCKRKTLPKGSGGSKDCLRVYRSTEWLKARSVGKRVYLKLSRIYGFESHREDKMRVRRLFKYKKSFRKKYNGRVCYAEGFAFSDKKHDTLKKKMIYKRNKDVDKKIQENKLNSWKLRLT